VLGRGTTVVAHPDGELAAYLGDLERLQALTGSRRGRATILARSRPGDPRRPPGWWLLSRAPARAARPGPSRRWLTAPHDVEGVLERVYADVPRSRLAGARLSIAAQLDYLVYLGRAGI
jgi:hypothetical protein